VVLGLGFAAAAAGPGTGASFGGEPDAMLLGCGSLSSWVRRLVACVGYDSFPPPASAPPAACFVSCYAAMGCPNGMDRCPPFDLDDLSDYRELAAIRVADFYWAGCCGA
jgi:hypothetical protein